MDLQDFTIPELETTFLNEGGEVLKGWFYEEQQKNIGAGAPSGSKSAAQFSVIDVYDISNNDILIRDGKRYKVVKVFKNLTHKDLSLKEING